MIVRKTSSQTTTTTATTATTSTTTTLSSNSSVASTTSSTSRKPLSDCEADDEKDIMSADDQSRPLTVAIPTAIGPHGPLYPRRPNLREILANTSPPPWTLAAFMAYLSSNHCLETLEFTMDAGRYKKHYAKMMSRATEGGDPPLKDREYVQALWERLVEAYIQPNGSREVNLPSDVRDPIVSLQATSHPPPPEALDPAVAKIYELMEESVLVPFLNSVYLQTAHSAPPSWPYAGNASDESVNNTSRDDHSHATYSRRSRPSPPLNTAVQPHSYSYSPTSSSTSTTSSTASGHHYFRKSAPVALPSSAPHRSRFSVKLGSPTSSTSSPRTTPAIAELASPSSDHHNNTSQSRGLQNSNSGCAPGMTDDSGSTGSPTHDGPMTPPMSPPEVVMSGSGSATSSGSGSGVSPKRDSGMWKKLGRLSGMKVGRKKSLSGLREEGGGAGKTV